MAIACCEAASWCPNAGTLCPETTPSALKMSILHLTPALTPMPERVPTLYPNLHRHYQCTDTKKGAAPTQSTVETMSLIRDVLQVGACQRLQHSTPVCTCSLAYHNAGRGALAIGAGSQAQRLAWRAARVMRPLLAHKPRATGRLGPTCSGIAAAASSDGAPRGARTATRGPEAASTGILLFLGWH